MRKMRIGKKPLRLLVLASILSISLTGCSGDSYQAVDLSETKAEVSSVERAAVSIDGTMSGEFVEQTGDAAELNEEETESVEETVSYEDESGQIIVTADMLNVRKTDSTESGIYVQLPQGEILDFTGFNDEWYRVIYDGEVAYVAADMVELYEEPETLAEEDAEPMEAADGETEEISVIAAASGEDFARNPDEEMVVQAPPNGYVVAIDAGHQAKANAEKEPIGPDSKTMKAKMPEGAVGAATGVEEYELTLTVAKKLEAKLEQLGYEVVMIRNGHDVNLSNAERSMIANESDADIFIRLHANSMENSGVYGALAMCMTEYNPYNAELYSQSYLLSKKIIDNVCALTGTKNRGVQKVDNSSAINWCEIPVSVVEMGFLTNPDEDRWLQDEEYQGKIVSGIATAVDSYFAEGQGM